MSARTLPEDVRALMGRVVKLDRFTAITGHPLSEQTVTGVFTVIDYEFPEPDVGLLGEGIVLAPGTAPGPTGMWQDVAYVTTGAESLAPFVRPSIPDGYVAFGWWRSRGLRSQVWESVVHLAPVEQGDRPYEGLCGVRRHRSTSPEPPNLLARDLTNGTRKPCQRCFKLAGRAAGA